MDEQITLKPPKDLNKQYFDTIRKNLSLLMECTGINQNHLVHLLEQRGMKANQGNISKFLSGDGGIQLSMIVAICQIYHVSFEQLIDEHYQYTPWNEDGNKTELPKLYSDDLLLHIPYLGDAFVIDPHDKHFTGYLQTYYVYLFPSQSEEERIRTGTLKLMANGSVCEAVLEINTNKLSDGKPYIKIYRGRCIISTTMRAVYVLLTDPQKGELSVLNFRYFNLLQLPLDCRIAGTLINATGEDHPPTLQRMFLSRMAIEPEHLNLLLPHLYLNSSTIRIRKDRLEALQKENELFREPIDILMRYLQPSPIYCMDEYDILLSARSLKKAHRHTYLSSIRSLSEHDCLNKASRRADHLSHELLISLGYFRDMEK